MRSAWTAAGLVTALAIALVGCSTGGSASTAVPSDGVAAIASPSSSPSPKATARPTPIPTPSPSPTPPPTPTPEPTPSSTPVPSFAIPTQGPPDADGIRPPLSRIAIPGADPAVIAAIDASIARLDELESYRFVTAVSGRNIVDISQAGLNFAMRGAVVGPAARADLRLTVELVEADGVASVASTVRVVSIGDDAWAIAPGRPPEPIPPDRPSYRIMEFLLPAGLAERLVMPFAGGFEVVESETHDGVPAVRYAATAAGLAAYAAACSLEEMRTADLWIAEEDGHLVGLDIVGRGGDRSGWFVTRIDVSDINDPTIEVDPPV